MKRPTSKSNPNKLLGIYLCISIFAMMVFLSCSTVQPTTLSPPYPQSQIISQISFDWSTHDRRAPGSDNWPVTWVDDDLQYTSWGDGGGFGGTNQDGRVSLGVAKLVGSRKSYKGYNIWGGKDSTKKAKFGGKSYGIISIENQLYMWVAPGSNTESYKEVRLYKSQDNGQSWKAASWAFPKSDGIITPTFAQFGKKYAGARDNYVYIYAIRRKRDDRLAVQKPGEIILMRAPKDSLMERKKYEFFTGLDSTQEPTWSQKFSAHKPVFTDQKNGVGWSASVSFNSGIKRYLLTTEHTETMKSNIGIFEAPEPWGPWSTVLFKNQFGYPNIASTAFFYNFSNAWTSKDGKDFSLVFTGVKENDSWNSVEGSLQLVE